MCQLYSKICQLYSKQCTCHWFGFVLIHVKLLQQVELYRFRVKHLGSRESAVLVLIFVESLTSPFIVALLLVFSFL